MSIFSFKLSAKQQTEFLEYFDNRSFLESTMIVNFCDKILWYYEFVSLYVRFIARCKLLFLYHLLNTTTTTIYIKICYID